MTTGRDLVFLLVAVAVLIAMLGLGWRARAHIRGFLTPREWRILRKLVAIGLFWFLLLMTNISRDFPASLFIYGRF